MKKSSLRFKHSAFSEQIAKELGVDNLISSVRSEVFEMQVDTVPEFNRFSDKVMARTGKRPEWLGLYDNDDRRLEKKVA